MPDTEYSQLIRTAKERASSGFQALGARAIQDAGKTISDASPRAKSGPEQAALNAVTHLLHRDADTFLRRMDDLFNTYLDRAMQTMYVDLRKDMRKLSIDELALIDDEAVNHQIEVGRLTERMREANEECIGRLNVIVARMHGSQEARERENPFRPYLLARTLYEAIGGKIADENRARVLFEHLSNALIQHLPSYYSAIREVFESSGVHGQFHVQRSPAAHHQRYFGAPPGDGAAISARVLPGLQRMFEAMQNLPSAGAAVAAGAVEQGDSVHEMIRKMLAPSKNFGLSRSASAAASDAVSASRLVAQLDRHQKAMADDEPAAGNMPAHDRLSALRDQLDLGNAPAKDRMIVDVVTLLFEFILEDEQIPAPLRQQIARLQIPLLKTALLQPDLLHEETHPARQLLNRLGSASIEAAPAVAEEIARTIREVAKDFDTDVAVFARSLQAFEAFLASHLRQFDSQIIPAIEAIEAAEKDGLLLADTTNALRDVLQPLNIDRRISDFIMQTWPQVLVRAASLDAEKKTPADDLGSLYRQYHAVLPELVWSIQQKRDQQERTSLIRLLPDLVKRLRAALQLIRLPDEQCKKILDLLVELHTTILRAVPGDEQKTPGSLDELRERFSCIATLREQAAASRNERPQPRADLIEEALARRNVAVELHLGVQASTISTADKQFLAQVYLPGIRVGMRTGDDVLVPARLVWVSAHRSLYLFRRDDGAGLSLYSPASLLEALRGESIIPVEYAPLFERAVEALLLDMEKLTAAAKE